VLILKPQHTRTHTHNSGRHIIKLWVGKQDNRELLGDVSEGGKTLEAMVEEYC
jgi:hypothetical protein